MTLKAIGPHTQNLDRTPLTHRRLAILALVLIVGCLEPSLYADTHTAGAQPGAATNDPAGTTVDASMLATLTRSSTHAKLGATKSKPGTPGSTPHWASMLSAPAPNPTGLSVDIPQDKALGVQHYSLDAHTEVLGWQVASRWYVGRQRGEDSGLTLVWQRDQRDQMSLSKDGIRFSRRF